eukprot:TRINITY_DN6732_c0_g1_i1.p1 TRINITY_DN6732_c0_g1~~TRINITY_DN6732_c0_g1_i1.p1  ORF type:complete len:929 (+),score=74.82 TRINITY_DN6732_c0_g1_i1:46-2787(+)
MNDHKLIYFRLPHIVSQIYNFTIITMKAVLLLLVVLTFSNVLGFPETNPYFVDPDSIQKNQFNWTFLIKNHKEDIQSYTNKEIKVGDVFIESLDSRVLHLKITDTSEKRWEAPLFNPAPGKHYSKHPMAQMGFEFSYDPFEFTITDPETSTVIVSTAGGSLLFYDKFLEIGLWYPTQRIFGLGERITKDLELCSDKKACIYTLFTRDEGSPYDDGKGGKNIYGVQPFYLMQLPSKQFVGVLSLNSNNQDANITRRDDGTANVYHKMIGGVFDMYFFYSGKAEDVIRKYHDLIGRPYVPPFWSLGFHMCRYGWKSLGVVKEVVAKFDQADIPLEVVWGDIDYMQDYADFTIDQVNYKGLGEFVNVLHKRKMKWVPIIDAGLKYDITDKYFKKGEENGAFIKSAWTSSTLIGTVWPGSAVFLSWYSPVSTEIWHEGLSDLFAQAHFDGIWLDMNEVSNFCVGECPDKPAPAKSEWDPLHDPNEFNDLPYYPGGHYPNEKTLSMTGYHPASNPTDEKLLKEHNVHTLWGTFEAQATYRFFVENQRKRPFILTRSNFPGTGMFSSKWLGDNSAGWDYMRYSIVGVYNYQLFGIPHIGADICGFFGDASKELCARWLQLGAFYPFSRSHHGGTGQEPYSYGEDVARTSRNALRQRYGILRYLHTKLFEAALNGGTVVKPTFFEYPLDNNTYAESGKNFMLGSELLVVPALEESVKEVNPYLPNENWYQFYGRERVLEYQSGQNDGKRIILEAGFDYVNVLIKGGSVVPYQDALSAKVRRTETLNYLPMEIIIAPDHSGNAFGTLIVDDDSSPNPIEEGAYRNYTFTFSQTEKSLHVTTSENETQKPMLFEYFSKVTVLGAEQWKTMTNACISIKKTGAQIYVSGHYDSMKNTLSFYKSGNVVTWSEIASIRFGANCQY